MREVLAVCRSSKKARSRTARVLDRYFWRIGDRTWRGRATNACLDRVARDLRAIATRNMAVMIQEVRPARESRLPLIMVGSRSAFSADGLVPVASHPARFAGRAALPETVASAHAVVQVAALFHDMGKATLLFQRKLDAALQGKKVEPGAVRHELVSAFAWDHLVAGQDDAGVIGRLRDATPACLDAAFTAAAALSGKLFARLREDGAPPLGLGFELRLDSLAFQVGALILTHHRLPTSEEDFSRFHADRHLHAPGSAASVPFDRASLAVAPGTPFWHEDWWLAALRQAADALRPGLGAQGLDMALRASLMFADHVASSRSVPRDLRPVGHLANTRDGRPADTLSDHVRKVVQDTRGAFDMLHRSRDRFPGLLEAEAPPALAHPEGLPARFRWQEEGARAARRLAAAAPGGFFACIIAGTGSGKTRGAPTILAGAAFGDAQPERRTLRMTLGLGLRVLATQSAAEYVRDLGFATRAVSVLVGRPPIAVLREDEAEDGTGSESRIAFPSWLQVEEARGDAIPSVGTEAEAPWLRGLSLDTDRQLPAFCARAILAAGTGAPAFRRMAEAPILVATVDHLMGVAAPSNSRFLPQAIRVLTADLILDEIDQYGPEDQAALCRLAYQVGAGGRRLLVMSATLTPDVASAFFDAYRAGWAAHAAASGGPDAVNLLCIGDAPGSCAVEAGAAAIGPALTRCRAAMVAALDAAPAVRRGHIIPACEDWAQMVEQVDRWCSTLHDRHATVIEGLRVSIGLVRMTRIAHVAALAAQLPAGAREGRLRLKLCLHARFPRLHRAWMEELLRRALTRKGDDPDAGLAALCRRFGVMERAAAAGAREVELVVVASPVIETGNDLDFDYAVVDPVSLRAVIQAAGRVNRHRLRPVADANLVLLARSPIVMQDGMLEMPGVETRPHPATRVARFLLDGFPERRSTDLIGAEAIAIPTARAFLAEGSSGPLGDAEAAARRAMLGIGAASPGPVARYMASPIARLSATMARLRQFRRSTTRDIVYALRGANFDDAEWCLDVSPGTASSRYHPATRLMVGELAAEEFLVRDMTRAAWLDFAGDGQDVGEAELLRLSRVEVPDYVGDDGVVPAMCYGSHIGLTRGSLDDLFETFGKRQ